MRLEQKPELEAPVNPVPAAKVSSDTGAQLETAREADAVWRAERNVRFAAGSSRVRRGGDRLERVLVILALASGGGLVLTMTAWRSFMRDDGTLTSGWTQMAVAAWCLLGWVGFSTAAYGVRRFTDWLDGRGRARAVRDGIELND